MELEPVELQNAKTSTAFLKKGKYIKKEKFLVNLSDLISEVLFPELKACFANPFPKRLMSILSIYLHHLTGFIRQIKL